MNHHRRSIRYPGYDYRSPGFYFITICSAQRRHIFGEVLAGDIVLSQAGMIVKKCWSDLPRSFANIRTDAFTVMPNHAHGVIEVLTDVAARPRGADFRQTPGGGTRHGSVSAVVQNLKSVSTRRIRNIMTDFAGPIWQRNYYEHIIRTEKSLNMIRLYIELNPRMWADNIELRDVRFKSEREIADLLEKYRDR